MFIISGLEGFSIRGKGLPFEIETGLMVHMPCWDSNRRSGPYTMLGLQQDMVFGPKFVVHLAFKQKGHENLSVPLSPANWDQAVQIRWSLNLKGCIAAAVTTSGLPVIATPAGNGRHFYTCHCAACTSTTMRRRVLPSIVDEVL